MKLKLVYNNFQNFLLTFKGFSIVYIFMCKSVFHLLLLLEPVGILDIWYMKQDIDYDRQQISLFWKVSFQCEIQGDY